MELQKRFITKLEQCYGPWEKETSRFGSATYGKIAQDLCISASSFSQLIYGSATEGMYIRALRNVERLLSEANLRHELHKIKSQSPSDLATPPPPVNYPKPAVLIVLAILISVLSILLYHFLSPKTSDVSADQLALHPLSDFFDRAYNAEFDSPYLNEAEVQEYCPCSAYEGTWELHSPYKLPLPGNKPGVYYYAKSADIRMKCSKSDTLNAGKGQVINAYEYLINEIWVDLKQTPISPKYFNKQTKTYTEEFQHIDFEDHPDFKKVATIHSFFIDKFIISDSTITRIGEPSGRYARDIDQKLADEFELDLKHILENVVGNLTKTNCNPTLNPYCDPNDLTEEESVISFDCLYTIRSENLGLGGGYPYTKGYKLIDQSYSDNLTCACDSH